MDEGGLSQDDHQGEQSDNEDGQRDSSLPMPIRGNREQDFRVQHVISTAGTATASTIGATLPFGLDRLFQCNDPGAFRPVIQEDSMMGDHSSYHNAIPGQEAIRRLKDSGLPHCYLTRFSEQRSIYVLTVYWKQSPRDVREHFPIKMRDGRYRIEGKLMDFETIGQLLDHYSVNRISPSLPSLGEQYTLNDYNVQSQSNCSIS